MSFKWHWIIHLFNLFGITNLKMDGKILAISKLHATLNILKICAFLKYKGELVDMVQQFVNSTFNELTYSPFSDLYLSIFGNQAVFYCIVTILLQLLTCYQNVILIDKMSSFRSEFLKVDVLIASHFEAYEQYCIKNVTIFLIFSAICFIIGFLASIQISFQSVLAYLIFLSPYYVSMAFVCYIFIILQFLIFSQNTLYYYATKILVKISAPNNKTCFDDILILQSSLFSIRKEFLSTLGFQTIIIVFYYISDIVGQVNCAIVNFSI